MAVYFLYGRLGSGKSLVATGRAIEAYGERGVALAVNYPLYVEHCPWPYADAPLFRLPDYPTSNDLRQLPAIKADGSITAETIAELETWDDEKLKEYLGGYNEKNQGILCLDEASHYLSARDWNDKDRHEVVRYLTQLRKYGWTLYLMVQSIEMIDKQARQSIAEHCVECKRLDRVAIPLVTRLTRLLVGIEVRPPRLHVGIVRYGTSLSSQIVDRWFTRGVNLFRFYNTRYVFKQDCGINGLVCMLTPYKYYGRLTPPWLHMMRLICQWFIDFHLEYIKPVRAYVLIALSMLIGWWAGKDDWFSGETGPIPAAMAEQIKIDSDPWRGVELVMEFGSIRKYEKNGQPVDVKRREVAGVSYYCIENECRN